MRSILLLLVFMSLAGSAHAQQGTWVDDTDPRFNDYLVLRPSALLVVRIDTAGECLGAPMKTWIDGDTLRRAVGKDWGLKVNQDSLTLHLPHKSRGFRRSDEPVIARCTADNSI
jgi:hypothetical protein